ncbi:MAG: hypothetical protein DIU58_010060 [Sphaerobacter thermophilus]|uniref:hypothetical protein n=1 Tax=Sphaerobacter thermophilus TaxID=2057 RepID=UPI000DB851E0|nr:MAG: hypothetical protein DIU58_11135 [Sphaerobacter thermophilus]
MRPRATEGQPSIAMIRDEARRQILSMAVDDAFGLWELRWTLEACFPEIPRPALLKIVQEALYGLVAAGLVAVEIDDPAAGSVQRTVDEAARIIAEERWWEPPAEPPAPRVVFFATPAGERAYLGREATASPRAASIRGGA